MSENTNERSAEANLALALLHLAAAQRKEPSAFLGKPEYAKALEYLNNARRRSKGQNTVPFSVLLSEDGSEFDDAITCITENFESLITETASWNEDMHVNMASNKVKHLSRETPGAN